MSKSTVFIELFPIRTATLPTLYAYRADETTALSQRAASQLADEHGGGWAQTGDLFVADVPPKKANFAAEAGLTPVKNYTPSPIAQADFLIQALIPKLADVMAQALQLPLQGNFRPLHEPLFKSWAVDGKPALSIGMIRRLVYRQDLAEYAARSRIEKAWSV